MTIPSDAVDRIRQLAAQLPATEERLCDGQPAFFVAGFRFAQLRDDMLILSGDGADRASITLTGDVDWAQIEDEFAQSWELAAPQELLEAGGR
jgi:hypothetical protein